MFLTAKEIASLEVKVAKYNRRAKRLKQSPVIFKIGAPLLLEEEEQWKVELIGEQPRIPGFEILGKIEPLEEGLNLVLPLPGKHVPAYYREADIECDHCKMARRRNATMVLEERATGNTRQVGFTCLGEYLQSKTAAELVNLSSLWAEFNDKSVLSDSEYKTHRNRYIHLSEFLPVVCMVIRKNGFISKRESQFQSTAIQAMNAYLALEEQPAVEDRILASQTLEYLHSLPASELRSEFMSNLWSLSQVELLEKKNVGFVAYMPVAWQKELLKRQTPQESSNFYGKPGDKFFAVATLIGLRPMDGGATIVKFKNEDGDILSWWSNKPVSFGVGEKVLLSATVKAHRTFGTEKTTQISKPDVRMLA